MFEELKNTKTTSKNVIKESVVTSSKNTITVTTTVTKSNAVNVISAQKNNKNFTVKIGIR